MINLLPPDYIAQIHSGRFNATLRRWFLAIIFATIGLVFMLASGWFYIDRQTKNLDQKIDITEQQLEQQDLVQVQKDAAKITSDVKLINQVLSREIRFSSLIQDMGKIMPQGTILDGLSLSKVSGAVDLSTSATDYNTAAQIAVNLSDKKNGLFSKVDIVNISCGSTTAEYKCSGTFKALFDPATGKNYLNVPSGDQP